MSYTKEQIDRMPSDEYRHKFNTEPAFKNAVDSLYAPVPATEVVVGPPAVEAEPAVEVPAVVIPAAVVPVVVAPVEPVEQVYEYDITDGEGRPVGGKQIFKYKTPEELREKQRQAHASAVVRMRELSRQVQILQKPAPSDNPVGPQFEEVPEFAKKPLTGEQLLEIQKLEADGKFDEANDIRFESQTGRRPNEFNQALNNMQQGLRVTRASLEMERFLIAHPEYPKCKANAEAMVAWMNNRGLDPVKENFEKAYYALQEASAIVPLPKNQASEPALAPAPPSVREEIPAAAAAAAAQIPSNTQAVQEASNRIVAEVPAQVTRPVAPIAPVATGLTRKNASEGEPISTTENQEISALNEKFSFERPVTVNGKPTGQMRKLTGIEALNAMSSEEYKKYHKQDQLYNTGFRKWADDILEKQEKRNKERQS